MEGVHTRTRRAPARGGNGPRPSFRYGDSVGQDRYLINGFAGTGATSYVYRGRRRDSFEPVAIKVIHRSLCDDPRKREALLREARVMMALEHPNVVRFHEIIEEDGLLLFVMEFIEGQTLSDFQKLHRDALDEQTLACVFVDILRGLSQAHRAGVVHRDLKPANVLITHLSGRYVAKIIDFGVARFLDEPLAPEDRTKIVGTAAYISPEEVADPQRVCEASDLYSLGVMLYEAACGRRPFTGLPIQDLMKAHLDQAPPPPRTLNPELTPGFEHVILRSLGKTPQERWASAPEMIRAMELALRGALDLPADERPDDQEALTTEWHRSVARIAQEQEAAQRGADLARAMRQLMAFLFLLMASTGSTGRGDDPHYMSRSLPPGGDWHGM